jgi:hypothetical protein
MFGLHHPWLWEASIAKGDIHDNDTASYPSTRRYSQHPSAPPVGWHACVPASVKRAGPASGAARYAVELLRKATAVGWPGRREWRHRHHSLRRSRT